MAKKHKKIIKPTKKMLKLLSSLLIIGALTSCKPNSLPDLTGKMDRPIKYIKYDKEVFPSILKSIEDGDETLYILLVRESVTTNYEESLSSLEDEVRAYNDTHNKYIFYRKKTSYDEDTKNEVIIEDALKFGSHMIIDYSSKSIFGLEGGYRIRMRLETKKEKDLPTKQKS